MRKYFYLILSAVTLFVVRGNLHSQGNYKVAFYIHDVPDTLLYIEAYCGGRTYIADSIKMSQDGAFYWQAKDYPEGMYLAKSLNKDLFSFMLGKSKEFSLEVYPNGEFFVTNCSENDAFFLFQKENKHIQESMYYYKLNAQAEPQKTDSLRNDILRQMDSFDVFKRQFFNTYPDNLITSVNQSMHQSIPSEFIENNQIKKGKETEYMVYYRQHYWDDFRFYDSRILYTPYFFKLWDAYISELTFNDPNTVCLAIDEFVTTAKKHSGKEYADYIISWYLENMSKIPFSFNEIIYHHVVEKYLDYASDFLLPSVAEYFRHKDGQIKPFLPGNIMPNVVLEDFNGISRSLYSMKNNYTVLYFYSSTCENCKKNREKLVDFYSNYAEKYDLGIYSIDIEQDIAICRAHQDLVKFPWVVVQGTVDGLAPYNFNLDHTPTMFILDKNKRILNKTASYEQVGQTVERDYNNRITDNKK